MLQKQASRRHTRDKRQRRRTTPWHARHQQREREREATTRDQRRRGERNTNERRKITSTTHNRTPQRHTSPHTHTHTHTQERERETSIRKHGSHTHRRNQDIRNPPCLLFHFVAVKAPIHRQTTSLPSNSLLRTDFRSSVARPRRPRPRLSSARWAQDAGAATPTKLLRLRSS